MTLIDFLVVAGYLLVIISIGLFYVKEAGNSTAEFFIAGRKLNWFMAGTSMVATTFSADTPLFVAGMTRKFGIAENWFWWCLAIGQIASVFFFARLWRRTNVVTDIEFLTLRYDKTKATNFLRVFKVVYEGLLINCLTMAVVLLSITKIIRVLVPYEDVIYTTLPVFGAVTTTTLIMLLLALMPLLFTVLAGLEGVVTAEVLQFGMAMAGSVTLAAIIYYSLAHEGVDAGGTASFLGNLRKAPSFKEALLAFTPSFSNFDLKAVGFIVLVGIGWWSFAPSNGYFVQRMLATKSEKDSLFALLWFNIAHYILRPWPWIIVGLASMYYLPNLVDAESAYPTMVNMFLPIGLKGLMVASLFAAFMSTTDTHLNWGTSYIINDLYQPFVRPGKEAKHYIKTSRIVMAVLSFITLVVATRLTGILSTFQIIYNVMGGVSLVMILRWYWWRVNVFSEISALLSSAIMTIALEGVASLSGPELYPIRLLINTGVTTTIWVTVTFLTSKQPAAQAIAFYEHMKISGPGWQRVKKLTGVKPIAGEFRENVIATITTLVFLYSLLIGIGKLIFADYTVASICLVFTILSAFNLRRVMRQMHISDAKIEG